jgi:hypothetical protein
MLQQMFYFKNFGVAEESRNTLEGIRTGCRNFLCLCAGVSTSFLAG